MTGILLDAGEIFASTAREHRLEEYADAGMRQRFGQLIESLNHYGTIADWARPAALAQLAGLVRIRLELARDWSLYPEIENERIERPFFVLGSARTGTSAMQCMLAMGNGCRAPLSWECRHPSPPPGLDPKADAEHIAAEHKHMMEMVNIMPGLLLTHPYVDAGAFMATEEEDLFCIDFRSIYPFHLTRVPVIPVLHQPISALADALRFHKKLLQHLQWKKPTQHWVCKGTQHHYQLPEIWKVYPDATCVWTHRDPIAVIASLLGLSTYVYTPVTGINIRDIAHEIVNGIAAGYEAIYNADWLKDERIIHVRFDDFTRDQSGAIRRICEHAGMKFSREHESRLQRWLADPAQKSDRHGKYIYSLEKHGLNPADIRKKFAGYYERFLT